MKNLAIIPARSGSKGLPDKNIKELKGKYLMQYSIEAAFNTELFTEVMVSTDSCQYASIARDCGAKVPFLRSGKNSNDDASTWDVVAEILNQYNVMGKSFDTFCLLQPTSPLRTDEDIINAYKILLKKAATAVISVCICEHSPLWCGQLDENCSLNGFISVGNNVQRQKISTFYRINGAIYIKKVSDFVDNHNMYCKGSFAYIMPKSRSIDIDTEFDFRIAEAVMDVNFSKT